MKKHIIISIWIITLGAVFGLGFFIGENTRPSIEKVEGLVNKQAGQPADVDFSLFWDAWHLIEKKYVERDDLDRQGMVFGAISGLLKSLDDPYTVFMEPEDSQRFLDDIKGSFEGIGAEIGIRKGTLTIVSPLEGNPAQEAGIQAGDKILKIDDTPTDDLNIDEAVNLIRGEKGTAVVLLISREGWDQSQEIRIIRDTIKIPVIKWEIKQDNIAYIQLFHFTETLPNEFRKVIKQVAQKNPRGIILDVRNNPGGFLEVAVDIASWFLPKGELVVVEDYGDQEQDEHRSRGYQGVQDIPLVVIINQGSASASEILAGALRDIRRIQVIGEKSFGKGSIQSLEKMKGGSSLKITVAKWLTPLGTSISEEGISPDIQVELTLEDIDQMRDPQLDKAIEVIKEIID